MKRFISAFLAMLLLVSCLSACTSDNKDSSKDELKIGIIQYMSHPSLDNCYNGIIDSLEKSGLNYSVDYQIGSSSSADTDCVNYAKNMVAEKCDLIVGIATNSAKAAFAATDDTDIPVVFCAVSDPIAAGLVESLEKPGYPCTGTLDQLDLKAQVALIQSMQPDVKKIGILYTSSEDNSISNLARFKTICEELGIEVVATAVQGASDIPSAADDLASKVDCINNFTDNNVVNNLQVVLNAADKYGIPVYGSEEEQVKNGCAASVSLDYYALGNVTGTMIAKIINGSDPSQMPVETIAEATPVINQEVCKKLELNNIA